MAGMTVEQLVSVKVQVTNRGELDKLNSQLKALQKTAQGVGSALGGTTQRFAQDMRQIAREQKTINQGLDKTRLLLNEITGTPGSSTAGKRNLRDLVRDSAQLVGNLERVQRAVDQAARSSERASRAFGGGTPVVNRQGGRTEERGIYEEHTKALQELQEELRKAREDTSRQRQAGMPGVGGVPIAISPKQGNSIKEASSEIAHAVREVVRSVTPAGTSPASTRLPGRVPVQTRSRRTATTSSSYGDLGLPPNAVWGVASTPTKTMDAVRERVARIARNIPADRFRGEFIGIGQQNVKTIADIERMMSQLAGLPPLVTTGPRGDHKWQQGARIQNAAEELKRLYASSGSDEYERIISQRTPTLRSSFAGGEHGLGGAAARLNQAASALISAAGALMRGGGMHGGAGGTLSTPFGRGLEGPFQRRSGFVPGPTRFDDPRGFGARAAIGGAGTKLAEKSQIAYDIFKNGQFAPGDEIGRFVVSRNHAAMPGYGTMSIADVDKGFRRHGIGRSVYDMAEADVEKPLAPSWFLKEGGFRFWNKRNPDLLKATMAGWLRYHAARGPEGQRDIRGTMKQPYYRKWMDKLGLSTLAIRAEQGDTLASGFWKRYHDEQVAKRAAQRAEEASRPVAPGQPGSRPAGRPGWLSQAEVERVRALHGEGFGRERIAEMTGIRRRTVQRMLADQEAVPNPRHYSEAKRARVLELVKQGKNRQEISTLVDIPERGVRLIADRAGLQVGSDSSRYRPEDYHARIAELRDLASPRTGRPMSFLQIARRMNEEKHWGKVTRNMVAGVINRAKKRGDTVSSSFGRGPVQPSELARMYGAMGMTQIADHMIARELMANPGMAAGEPGNILHSARGLAALNPPRSWMGDRRAFYFRGPAANDTNRRRTRLHLADEGDTLASGFTRTALIHASQNALKELGQVNKVTGRLVSRFGRTFVNDAQIEQERALALDEHKRVLKQWSGADSMSIKDIPSGTSAIIHNHPNFGYGANGGGFSSEDFAFALKHPNIALGAYTASGSLFGMMANDAALKSRGDYHTNDLIAKGMPKKEAKAAGMHAAVEEFTGQYEQAMRAAYDTAKRARLTDRTAYQYASHAAAQEMENNGFLSDYSSLLKGVERGTIGRANRAIGGQRIAGLLHGDPFVEAYSSARTGIGRGIRDMRETQAYYSGSEEARGPLQRRAERRNADLDDVIVARQRDERNRNRLLGNHEGFLPRVMGSTTTGLGLRQILAFGGLFGGVHEVKKSLDLGGEYDQIWRSIMYAKKDRDVQNLPALRESIDTLAASGSYDPIDVMKAAQASAFSGRPATETAKALPIALQLAQASALRGHEHEVSGTEAMNFIKMLNTGAGVSYDAMPGVVNTISALQSSFANVDIKSLSEGAKTGIPIAKQFGVNPEQAFAMIALEQESGQRNSRAGTMVRAMLQGILGKEWKEKDRKKISDLGINITPGAEGSLVDKNGKLKNGDIIPFLTAFQKAYDDPAKKGKLLAALGTYTAKGAAETLFSEHSIERIGRAIAEAHGDPQYLENMAKQMQLGYTGSKRRLGYLLENFGVTLGGEKGFGGPATILMTKMGDYVRDGSAWLKDYFKANPNAPTGIASSAIAGGSTLLGGLGLAGLMKVTGVSALLRGILPGWASRIVGLINPWTAAIVAGIVAANDEDLQYALGLKTEKDNAHPHSIGEYLRKKFANFSKTVDDIATWLTKTVDSAFGTDATGWWNKAKKSTADYNKKFKQAYGFEPPPGYGGAPGQRAMPDPNSPEGQRLIRDHAATGVATGAGPTTSLPIVDEIAEAVEKAKQRAYLRNLGTSEKTGMAGAFGAAQAGVNTDGAPSTTWQDILKAIQDFLITPAHAEGSSLGGGPGADGVMGGASAAFADSFQATADMVRALGEAATTAASGVSSLGSAAAAAAGALSALQNIQIPQFGPAYGSINSRPQVNTGRSSPVVTSI